jgi:hypothetical protein
MKPSSGEARGDRGESEPDARHNQVSRADSSASANKSLSRVLEKSSLNLYPVDGCNALTNAWGARRKCRNESFIVRRTASICWSVSSRVPPVTTVSHPDPSFSKDPSPTRSVSSGRTPPSASPPPCGFACCLLAKDGSARAAPPQKAACGRNVSSPPRCRRSSPVLLGGRRARCRITPSRSMLSADSAVVRMLASNLTKADCTSSG